jgi:hypothetical protein
MKSARVARDTEVVMLHKGTLIVLLILLAALATWPARVALSQTETGEAHGVVNLCSNDNARAKREGWLVNISMVNLADDRYNKDFTWGKCKLQPDGKKVNPNCNSCGDLYPNCQNHKKDPGKFTISGLLTGRWLFRASRENYIPMKTSDEEGVVIRSGTNSIEPPSPLLVKQGRNAPCPDLARLDPAGSRVFDTVASPVGAGGDKGYIVLTLYERASSQSDPVVRRGKIVNLNGKVVDTGGNELSGASVFVTDLNGEEDEDASPLMGDAPTDAHGKFNFDVTVNLEESAYLFSVKLAGFKTLVMDLNDAVKLLGDNKDLVLKREGELSKSGTPLAETLEATRRSVFTPEVMQTLPVRGTRSFDEFALLAPGVLPPPETYGGVGPGVSAGVGTAGQFSVNGLRSRENNFNIDGSDNNDEDIGTRRQGFVMTVPQPIESVQELQVITALGDARFGRNIGGQINTLTRTGGLGTFHGSLYLYATTGRLGARNPLDQSAASAPAASTLSRASDGAPVLLDAVPLVVRNPVAGKDQSRHVQVGLAMGGQLGGTFYFVSAERQDIRADREAHFAVPTVRQRGAFGSGDTGLLLMNGQNARTPLYPASVPGDAVFSLYPFPNNPRGPYGENTYSAVLPADGHGTRFSIKLDRQFSNELPDCDAESGCKTWLKRIFTRSHIDQLTGRYNFTDELSTLPVTGGALFSTMRPMVRTQNLALFFNRTLSGSTSDTIRFSFGRTRLSFGERRDATLLPSSALPGTQFLLNAPLLLNVTRPNADGTLNSPAFVSAAGAQGSALLASLGYQGVTQTEQITGPLGQVFVAGFSPIGVDTENFPQERANNTWQLADTITSVRENHVFTFGVDMRKTRINSTLDRNFRPRAVFNGLPGAAFADTLLRPGGGVASTGPLSGATLAAAGVPTGLFQALAQDPDSRIGIHFTQVNLFFQDQWRIRPNLHLTAGVRYEFNTVPDTVGHKLEDAFDPEELRTQAQQAAAFCNSPRCNDLVASLTSAFPADFKVSFGSDRNDFDGRLGFAWVPWEGTSVRGGFGTYSGQFPGIVIDQSRNAFPSFLPLNLANFTPRSGNQTFLFNLANPAVRQLSPGLRVIAPGTLNQFPSVNPIAFLANQVFNLSDLSLSPTALGLDLVLPQRSLKAPYAYHYGLTVEHEFRDDYLLSVAYVGTRGVKLLRVATPDNGLNDSRFAGPVGVSALTPAEPFPFFSGRILPPQANLISQSFAIARTFFESSAQSSYNSLQAEFRKRYSHAFLVGSAFTYSHSIDDASDFFDNAGAFALPQNSPRRDERASSNFDVRVRSASYFVLDVQKEWIGRADWKDTRKEWLRDALGGLQLSGIFTAQSGQPYTINSAFDVNRDGSLTDRLNTTAGIIREQGRGPVQLRLASGVNPLDLLAPDGFDGSVGRNTFRAPHVYSFDFAVSDALRSFGEHKRFVVRAEFFNLFNWANYGVPVRILESPGFGNSVRTLIPPRTIQFVGRFQF